MGEAYLEVRRDGRVDTVALAGDRITIGRAPESLVAFPTDGGVSEQHAELVRSAEGWLLRDVGSQNGTYLNGHRLVTQQVLRPGDEIALGSNRIVLRTSAADAYGSGAAPAPPAFYLDAGEEWRGTAPAGQIPPPAGRGPLPPQAPSRPGPGPIAPPGPMPSAAPGQGRSERSARPHDRGRAHVRGVARGIQIRRSSDERDILAFRVDRYDAFGNRLDPVAVELWAYSGGQINEGEDVDVVGDWKRGTVHARKILNLSTNAEVRGLSPVAKGGLFVAYAAVILFILAIVVMIILG